MFHKSSNSSKTYALFFLKFSYYSEIESEDEIYSCQQLEAFNSLPKTKKQQQQPDTQLLKENQCDTDLIENNLKQEQDLITVQVADQKPIVSGIEQEKSQKICKSIEQKQSNEVNNLKRIVPLKKNQLERKSNPKTVTASVFKTISPDVKLLKTIPLTNTTTTSATSTVRHMIDVEQKSTKSVANNNNNALLITSKLCRSEGINDTSDVAQKVVTASLIHKRKDQIILQKSIPSPAQQNMNKTFFMFSDNAPQHCCEYIIIYHASMASN